MVLGNTEDEAIKAQRYDLEERLLESATQTIKLIEEIPGTRAGSHVAGQLLRSATSPLANHGEAQAAESRDDSIHKLRVSLKELREKMTLYFDAGAREVWLCDFSGTMRFFEPSTPQPVAQSQLAPQFPRRVVLT